MNLDAAYDVFPVLHTERLLLRQQSLADAPGILAIYGDLEVARFTDMRPISDIQEARRLIEGASRHFAERRVLRWGIVRTDTGELIGTCACLGFQEQSARTELGYDLLRSHWNQGYMTEALQAVLQLCFETVGVNRVQAMTLPWNVASMRVLHKLGFREEGVLRQYVHFKGAFHDMRIFGLLQGDYDSGASP